MTIAAKIGELRERARAYWIARTDQERRLLTIRGIDV